MKQKNKVIPEENPLKNPDNINLKTATLELTHKNNLYNMMSPVTQPVTDELNGNGWIKVIDKLDQMGVEQVTLTGGEPTVKEDFYGILGYAINTIGDVTVQTNGTTDTKLSSYRCTVAVEILDPNSYYHNQVLRQTDPREYVYDKKNQALIRQDGGDCMYCDKTISDKNGCRLHLKSKHKGQVMKDLNDELGLDLKEWDETRNQIQDNPELDFGFFLRKKYDLGERENALSKAFDKAERIERPTIIKSSIFENNDVEGVMSMAEMINASTVFTPLKPSGKARENFWDQMPSPARMQDVMEKVHAFNAILSTNHTIDTPIYKAYQWRRERDGLQQGNSRREIQELYHLENKIEKYWDRGRIDDVGVSTINILPNGDITPSPHLRDYKLGNILSSSGTEINQAFADWNDKIFEEKYLRPAKGTDMRVKSIASDIDVVLNNPYKKP